MCHPVEMVRYLVSDEDLREMSRIVNRPSWVEAVPHMSASSLRVRRAIMHEKFRRAVLRAQTKAA